MTGPESIGEEVRRELKRFSPSGAMADVVRAWPLVVGEAIASNAWPARLARDGTLHVATSSSAWAFELGLLEPDIRRRLSAALGPEAPEGLRFAPGKLPEPPTRAAHPERARTPRPSASDRREAERLAAQIGDENLRKVVAKAAAESLARSADRPGRLLD